MTWQFSRRYSLWGGAFLFRLHWVNYISAVTQATAALNSLSIPMPDLNVRMGHGNSLEDELAGLPESEKSYYRRHKDLIDDPDENESEDQPLDRANMTAVLVQYLKSKEPDYLPDDIREKAAMQDFKVLYDDLTDGELKETIQNLFDSEKQAQHFQQEIQSGNYDQNALIHEQGYTQYAISQGYQQDPIGGIHGIISVMGLTSAFGGGSGKNDGTENLDQIVNRDENESKIQESTDAWNMEKPSVPTKTDAGSDPDNYVNQHAQKHIYDTSTTSTPSKTQYGKDVDVKELVEDTMRNPDSVETKYADPSTGQKGITVYKKEYGGNISTDETPTGEHRVFENHDDPSRSTHYPYVPRIK